MVPLQGEDFREDFNFLSGQPQDADLLIEKGPLDTSPQGLP